jgi:adhesin transport system outer membrane protein
VEWLGELSRGAADVSHGSIHVQADINPGSIRGNASLFHTIPRAFKWILMFALISLFPLTGQAEESDPSLSAMRLDQLISVALSSHPEAQVQLSLQESARADVDSANWQFYPTLSLAIENARSGELDPSSQGDSMVSILRLQQPLWAGGRLTAGLSKAEASVIVSQASLAQTRQQLALRVVQAYGEWLAAELKTRAYEKSRVTHVRLRDQVKRRIEQGVSAESDLILAVSRLQSVVAETAVARAQMDIALTRLGQLLGMDPAAFKLAIVAPRPVSSSVQQQLEIALEVSPALRKAQAETRVQKAVIAERRANLSPEVFLRVERQYGNASIRNAEPENRIVLGVDSRFGAGLSSLSNVKGAEAKYQAALAEVEVQRRTVNELVLADYALAVSSKVRVDALRDSLNAARQVSESYDRQFLAGRKTWVDVMNAARDLAQTEVQLADIQSTQVVVTWRLAIYTGGTDDRAVLIDKSMHQAGAGDAGLADGHHSQRTSCRSDPSTQPRQSICQQPGQWDATGEVLVSDAAVEVSGQ